MSTVSTQKSRPPMPITFTAYAAATAAAAVLLTAALPWARGWRITASGTFALLSALVLVGELMPIAVPRRRGLAKITLSTTFAFAILFRFGVGPAIAVYVTSLVIADGVARVAAVKVLFNAGQYALAVLAAAAVLHLVGHLPAAHFSASDLLGGLLAAAAFFAANHVLACVGAALLAGLPVVPYLLDDLPFQAWTVGCLIAFAPALLAAANASVALIPVSCVPVLAVYMGAREAMANSRRALQDPLTELPNRAFFTEALQTALAHRREGHDPLAVLLLDLDDFKAINDTLGHEFGDVVLQQVAQRLDGAMSSNATLARLGGDEFAVLVEGGQASAESLAQRVLEALECPLELESLTLHVVASVGVACWPAHGRTGAELLRHADVAMYCAKASDAHVRMYAEEHDEYSIDRLALAAQLRRGIERGELVVHYQAKAPLKPSRTCAVEALVRWNHPQLGWIGPDGFIPLAEQTGIITPLTRSVFESAIGQCARWREQGHEVTVAVNVSTRSLFDHDLLPMIRELLERFAVPARLLQLEITESRSVSDLARARSTLEALRRLGVLIALDDFGTGYSSLSQLQQLPIDEIKIDRSFVTRMESDRSDAALVRSIIDLGRSLGLAITAEGVESEQVQRSLRELGCDFAQGFHVGRPAPARDCLPFLEAHGAREDARLADTPLALVAVS